MRLTITFVELDGEPYLRITVDGEVIDYPLTIGQTKLIAYQLIRWIWVHEK